MGTQMIQIIIMAAVAIFLFLRLRSILGTRDGFEGPPKEGRIKRKLPPELEVIEGGEDPDISDFVEPESEAAKALATMKRVEPAFSVTEFVQGARSAYEMILMAFENGDLDFLRDFLAPDVYEGFATAVTTREDKGLKVSAEFHGISEIKLRDAKFDVENSEAEITMYFVGEMTTVVRDEAGEIVEGDPNTTQKQRDTWTFARLMGTDNPNWLLVATGE